MAGHRNPFDQFDGAAPGFVPLTAPNPVSQYKGPQAAADLARTGVDTARAQTGMALDSARLPYVGPTAKAEMLKAQAEAVVAQQNAAGAAPVAPNSSVHGDDYLKTLPAGLGATVKAVASGNVMLPANALRVPYWQQVLQHTLNYDPEFNAADYNTRASTRQNFATGKMGLNITALNTALGHAGQLQQDASALDNYGGWLGGNIINPVRNFLRGHSDPAITNFQNDARAYGGEKTAVFANGGGGQGEREDAAASIPLNGTPDQQIGVLSHDAELFKSRLDALNDQYKRGMGHTADITDLLNPHAREVYQQLLAQGGIQSAPGAAVPGALPPAGPPGAPPAPGNPFNPGGAGPMPNGGGGMSLATGATRQVPLNHVNAIIDSMVRAGKSAQEIGAALQGTGVGTPSDAEVQAAQAYLAKYPQYKGSFGGVTQTLPNSTLQQVAGGPLGALAVSAGNAASGGSLPAIAGGISALEGNGYSAGRDQFNIAHGLQQDANPGASLTGDILGGAGAMAGLEAGAAKYGLGKLATPAAEAAYGGLSGYNQGGLGGALTGAVAAPLAGMFGRKVIAPAIRPITTPIGNAIRSIAPNAADRIGIAAPVAAPSTADATALAALQRAGVPGVRQSLQEAQSLGVPMALADTDPALRSLAGAAVRRSPNAAGIAENALLPRSRGQIDRLQSAVTRDLGPVSNIPQTSADLTAQARAAAGPLYDKAFSNPGASSVDLSDLATKPSFKAALNQAHNIALEDGVDPTTLGFDLDQHGNVTLNRVPSFQTLDYVKQGLDATLEPHRNPLTGKLDLTPATRPINNTKNALLDRMDAVNPDYKAARATYAGPVQARDALVRGQDAFSLSPDELGMQVGAQSPEHLAQMQTGYRSELMNRAGNLRDSTNPFEATLGTPNARARLDTLYPGNPGNANLFRQRDLEAQLARTNTDVIGGSQTAGRHIADQAFQGSAIPGMAIDAALMAHGGVPVASIARGIGSGSAKDALTLGLGKRAVAKADALAPLLLNTDPAANLVTIDGLSANSAAYRNYIDNLRSRRLSGMFGAALGSIGAGALTGQK